MIIEVLFILVLIGLDQLVKYLTVLYLKGNESVIIIENIFELTYVENRGAAFGMMQNQRTFFLIVTTVVLILMIFYYTKIPRMKRYNLLRFSTLLFIAGAIGNLIDRMRLSYVIDTFYFSLIDFPVFNIADSYVVIAAFLYIFLLLFYYKDHELRFLKIRRNHNENNKF